MCQDYTRSGIVLTRIRAWLLDRSEILVPDYHEAEARELLVDAGLGNWLRP